MKRVINHDIYLQLDYTVGPLRLTLGDRQIFHRYKHRGDDYWTLSGAVYKRLGALGLTCGVDLCHLVMADGNPASTYADVRLSPMVSLPDGWQASGRLVWYSKDAPRRALTADTALYGSLQLSKLLGSHWHLQLQWHDAFCSSLSALLGSVAYRF